MITWLLYCAAPRADQVRLGRLLAGLLLILIGATALTSLGNLMLQQTTGATGVTVLLLALFGGLYIANRRGWVTGAAGGVIAAIMIIVPLMSLDPQTQGISAAVLPATLLVPVALAGVLLAWRAVLLATLGATVETLILFNVLNFARLDYSRTNDTDTWR